MPPLAVPSSLVSTTPADVHCLLELLGLAQAVLTCRRVDHEQGLVLCSGHLPLDDPARLLELAHEVDLGVEAPGGVDEHDVGSARARGDEAVVHDRCGVAALILLDDVATDARGPLAELLHGGGAERVAGDHHRGLAELAEAPGHLADGRRLARPR